MGAIMIFLIIFAWFGRNIRDSKINSERKENAIRRNQDTYMDFYGYDRWVKTDERVIRCTYKGDDVLQGIKTNRVYINYSELQREKKMIKKMIEDAKFEEANEKLKEEAIANGQEWYAVNQKGLAKRKYFRFSDGRELIRNDNETFTDRETWFYVIFDKSSIAAWNNVRFNSEIIAGVLYDEFNKDEFIKAIEIGAPFDVKLLDIAKENGVELDDEMQKRAEELAYDLTK